MDVVSEISALRDWLREDETRLASVQPQSRVNFSSGADASAEYNFNDHSNWYNTPANPGDWKNWSNWSNGG